MGKISVETDEAFRISLPGKSVDSTDMLDYAVHSGFDYPKIEEDMVGIVDYTVPASLSVGTINIFTKVIAPGYTPMSMTFMEDIDNVTPTEFATLPYYEGFSGNYFRAWTSGTRYKIDFVVAFAASAWRGKKFRFKYNIFVND